MIDKQLFLLAERLRASRAKSAAREPKATEAKGARSREKARAREARGEHGK